MHKGYVLAMELAKYAKVNQAIFYQINGVKLAKMGRYCIVKVDSLPKKYQEPSKKCLIDLEKYISLQELELMLSVGKDSIYHKICQGKIQIPRLRFGRYSFFKMSDEFLKLCKEGKTPYYIKKDEVDAVDDIVIDMCGLKIGFY